CLKLLVDPQRLTRGRIRERGAYCLRASSLLAEITALVASKPRRTVNRRAFRRCGVLGQLRREYELPVHVGCDQSPRPLMCQGVRHARTPVAPLRDPAVVAETLHQSCPGAGDPIEIPTRLGRLVGESEARERRDDDMERVRRPPAKARGITERPDNLHELHE